MKAKWKRTSPRPAETKIEEQNPATSHQGDAPLYALMDVELPMEPWNVNAHDQVISKRSNGKMKAMEEESGEDADPWREFADALPDAANTGNNEVDMGWSDLLEDFFKLSFADALPDAPEIPTMARAIRAVPFPNSKPTCSEVRTAQCFDVQLPIWQFSSRQTGASPQQVMWLLICSQHRKCCKMRSDNQPVFLNRWWNSESF